MKQKKWIEWSVSYGAASSNWYTWNQCPQWVGWHSGWLLATLLLALLELGNFASDSICCFLSWPSDSLTHTPVSPKLQIFTSSSFQFLPLSLQPPWPPRAIHSSQDSTGLCLSLSSVLCILKVLQTVSWNSHRTLFHSSSLSFLIRGHGPSLQPMYLELLFHIFCMVF